MTVPAVDDKRVFHPSPIATGVVALALLIAALIVLGRLHLGGAFLPPSIFHAGTRSLALVFFLRAIGEFRFVGFFKRIRDTRFAYWDTRLFSPLCLLMSMLAFWLAYTAA